MRKSRLSEAFETFMELVNGPILKLYSSYRSLEPMVLGSKISTSFEKYARLSAFGTVVAMVVMGTVLGLFVYEYMKDIVLAVLIAVFSAIAIVLPLAFSLFIAIPSLLYSNRRGVLEAKFPRISMTLSLLLASGIGLTQVFEELEKKFLKELKYFDLEISMVNALIKTGVPVDEALRRVAQITPSQSLKELFIGLASVARVGGDPAAVVRAIMNQYTDRYSMMVEKTVNDMGVLMEMYLAFALLVPILLGSIAVLFIFNPMPGLSFEGIMFLTIFVLVPIFSIAILVMVDTMVSKLRV